MDEDDEVDGLFGDDWKAESVEDVVDDVEVPVDVEDVGLNWVSEEVDGVNVSTFEVVVVAPVPEVKSTPNDVNVPVSIPLKEVELSPSALFPRINDVS